MHHMAIANLPQELRAALARYDREPVSRALDPPLSDSELSWFNRQRIKRARLAGAGDDCETDYDHRAEAN